MSIAKLCDVIESHEMAAEVNVASDLRTVIEIVRMNPIVRELGEQLKKPGVAGRFLSRIFTLREQATDVRYENPNDTALFIYMWLLQRYNRFLALMASATICRVPNLWWAAKFATELIEQRLGQNVMAGEVSKPVPAANSAGDRVFVTDTSFLPSPLYLERSSTFTSRERSDLLTAVISGDPTVPSVSVQSYDTGRLELIAA